VKLRFIVASAIMFGERPGCAPAPWEPNTRCRDVGIDGTALSI
jgi:hypothetical protein